MTITPTPAEVEAARAFDASPGMLVYLKPTYEDKIIKARVNSCTHQGVQVTRFTDEESSVVWWSGDVVGIAVDDLATLGCVLGKLEEVIRIQSEDDTAYCDFEIVKYTASSDLPPGATLEDRVQKWHVMARFPLADYVIGEGPTRVAAVVDAMLKMKEDK